MSVSLSPIFNAFQGFTDSGIPLMGGQLYTYQAGTSTPAATYTTAAGNIANSNPIIFNAAGRPPFQIWLTDGQAYRFVLLDFPGNQIGTYDNISGSDDSGTAASLVATLRADLASTASASDGDALVGVKWTSSVGVATTQHQMNEDSATVMNTIADSLKPAIRDQTTTTAVTAAMQTYMQWCYDNNGQIVLPAGKFLIGPIALTCSGGELSGGLKITGAGKNATLIKQSGSSSTSLITITGAGNPTTISLMLRDLTIEGNGKTCPGLTLDKCAGWHLDNVAIRDFTVALELKSSLIGSMTNTALSRNNIGMRTRQNGANAFCNLITVGQGCQIIFNTQFGLDVGACDTLNVVDGAQIESNGVNQSTSTVTVTSATPGVVTWNAHGLVADDPVIFTNSGGALPTGITADYIYYVSSAGLTTNTFQFSATVGGASVATASTGTGTHTASSPKTGGIVIRKTVVDELGAVTVNIDKARFEGNHGADFRAEYMSTAFGLYVNMRDCLMAGTSDGPMIAIGFARKVAIEGCIAPVGSSTWNINTDQLTLKDSKVISLKRPGGVATSTLVFNSGFDGVEYANGETGSFTASLTGCTTVPTGTITYCIQGDEVTLNIPNITATSNTPAASLTGMPAILAPFSTARSQIGIVRDNGADKVSQYDVQTSGTINLANGTSGTFTNSGTKGTQRSTITYKK